MGELKPKHFKEFFGQLYQDARGKPLRPFPWQQMLVERVAEEGWPEGIDLPTASGKTACIDIAVFLLAMGEQEGWLSPDHPARRRIFFVVDRRIVVDEAHQRAERLAQKLDDSQNGILKKVADRLRALAGGTTPLIASRLRGGTVQDERWRLSPAQPAVITSTVDQIGSRLLFRSYGSSNLTAPIEAALTACDSLVLLDEAHCAVPFMQTARAVQRYSGPDWIEGDAIASSLTFSILSATLPKDVNHIFPKPDQREAALDHSELQRRIKASKPAELEEIKPKRGQDDALVPEAAQRAKTLAEQGRKRVAVMVNRVATAAQIASNLGVDADADVVLMTGRMRPIDRDALVTQWSSYLKAGSNAEPKKPIIVVTTQCLEVGADFSFDALITECASLDALRQRFGRLNRLGSFENVEAAVLIRKGDVKPDSKLDNAKPLDPIYGNAMARTWKWLEAKADDEARFDFGVDAIGRALPPNGSERVELLERLNAPFSNAPVMLPAHVDFLCQTAPQPTPDPDVSIFLHGPQRSAPEARVVFRADLVDLDVAHWHDAVALLPPLTAEALNVPAWLIRKWLADELKPQDADELGDVEGQRTSDENARRHGGRRFVLWRNRRESTVSRAPAEIRPNDTIVVPAHQELVESLEKAHAICRLPDTPLDVAEKAYRTGQNRPVLRLVNSVFKQAGLPSGLVDNTPLNELLDWAREEDRDEGTLTNVIFPTLLAHQPDPESEAPELPTWVRDAIEAFQDVKPRIELHPAGGLILLGKSTAEKPALPDTDFGDADDALSATDQPVPLPEHSQRVLARAETWAQRCISPPLVEPVKIASKLHDLGKADPRFQIILHGEETDASVSMENGNLLAKSDGLYRPLSVQRRLREVAGLPDQFRHEMLSMQLAAAGNNQLPVAADWRDLVLHLIASHHGYGRPFAPVCIDDAPPDVNVDSVTLTASQRRGLIPPHRLDSRVAERFWKLTRRYGWWGLAYLEALLRLADRAASAAESAASTANQHEVTR